VLAEVASTTAMGECVDARFSLAVNTKSGIFATAWHHARPIVGLMCP
jgi:hypothetical protein